MEIVTKFTEYNIGVPEFFIEYIKAELEIRDVKGLSAGRIEALYPTGEHPLVRLTGAVLGSQKPDFSGLLPAISVIEADEIEEGTTIGQGLRNYSIIDQTFVTNLKTAYPDMKDRIKEGLITDEQLQLVELRLSQRSDGQLLLEKYEYWQREAVFISLWAHNLQERQIMGRLLRSVIYDMRKELIDNGADDIHIQTSKGLVNFNFGRILHGQETEISLINSFCNLNIYEDEIIDTTLPVATVADFLKINSRVCQQS